MAYIANKPIRFDRDYHIGEIIPETVIDPMMARKLTDMGKIICVTLPTDGGAEVTPDSAGQPTGGAESTDGAAEGAQEFKCDICGRAFGSANALSAHSRVHKQ